MKYEITGETLQFDGRTLHRIKALIAIPGRRVEAGDLGGYVESYGNLSQEGAAWIADDAKVFGNAEVCGDAKVCCDAEVSGDALVYGAAMVSGYAKVSGMAEVFDDAKVYGGAKVCGDAEVSGAAIVYGAAMVCDAAEVSGKARVYGKAHVYGDAEVSGEARVYGAARVCDGAAAFGKSRVSGRAMVCCKARIGGEAVVRALKDFIVFKNFWSSGRSFTWTRSDNMYQVGCFRGTGAELVARAYGDSERSGREYGRVVEYVEAALIGMAGDSLAPPSRVAEAADSTQEDSAEKEESLTS